MSTAGDYEAPGSVVHRARGVTDGSGNVTFTWPAGAFVVAPIVTFGLEAAAGFRSVRISANSTTATTVNVLVAAGVTVLGIGVLAVGAAASGVTVHAQAVAP